ncbi:MAG: alpha/beta hydrolase [bacterium]
MTTVVGIAVFVLVFWWGVRAFERANLFIPSRLLEAKPDDIGLEFENIPIEADDSVMLHAWFVPADQPIATLLFCHGNAGNISHRLDSIRIFHEMNLNVLIFDYRGYGRSDGRPSEQGTYLDAQAAYKYAKSKDAPVVIFGRSLGGAVAVDLASRVDDAAALIVESAFTSTIAMGKEIYPFLPVSKIVTMPYNSLSKIPRVRCPVLVIHSPEDDIIPYHHGQELFEAAPEPKQFLQISGDHNGGYIESGTTYTEGVKRFLAETLQTDKKSKS